MAIAART
jgi:polyisoprenoid-binding protein YceI